MTEIDKVALIYIQDRRILTARSKGKDKYYIPGGKREAGENDTATLIREIKEELNVDVIPSSIQFCGIFKAQADSHPEGKIVRMTCYSALFEGELTPMSEIEELSFMSSADAKRCSAVDEIIFKHLLDEGLID
ncbi:NUDIX hydrolase [Sphingobacterium spiritivorum]|uniref:Pyrimidine (Deoxy)nucleoside triphosphate pyrophosphohydrolase n=2 Tax=Sphingobacterium spiritivorum TaxID=258 RepID=A0A380BM19_SPHSI|nr:NUDIX domain-containing protein [Sphingobacterium spiritivorum]SUJ02476.1 pyrimidine (deoxy)nucleoside triphosphate pyrophosphohydrolase [Sphingobacterium spiritivorum]